MHWSNNFRTKIPVTCLLSQQNPMQLLCIAVNYAIHTPLLLCIGTHVYSLIIKCCVFFHSSADWSSYVDIIGYGSHNIWQSHCTHVTYMY